VIWLHGLGADGNDFAPIVPELRLPATAAIRFIFPHAPAIPVTINGGYVMPAWYDIMEMQIDRRIDSKGLMASARTINGFIDRELDRGIDSRRIIIAGFSQGGAVAYQAVLSHDKPLGACWPCPPTWPLPIALNIKLSTRRSRSRSSTACTTRSFPSILAVKLWPA